MCHLECQGCIKSWAAWKGLGLSSQKKAETSAARKEYWVEPFPTHRDGAPTLTGPFLCFPGRHLLLLKCFRGSASSLGKALEYSLPKKPLVTQSLPGTQAPRRLLTKLKLSSYRREVLQPHGGFTPLQYYTFTQENLLLHLPQHPEGPTWPSTTREQPAAPRGHPRVQTDRQTDRPFPGRTHHPGSPSPGAKRCSWKQKGLAETSL